MAVVLAVVAAILLVTWRPDPDPVRVVDVDPLIIVATSQAEFPIVVPTLPGLRPTSVRWEPTTESEGDPVWHVGYVTQTDQYLEITQSTASSPEFLLAETGQGEFQGTIDIDGQQWQSFASTVGDSLVNVSGEVITIVQGTGAQAELIAGVQSLAPAEFELTD